MTRSQGARLIYERWTDPIADKMLSGNSRIELARLDLEAVPERNWRLLERAHGYQAATRTDCARVADGAQWLAGGDLIARCPDLLAVCVAGAGYDVVDVGACTDAGVLVCNNSGPGAEAVAEHALGLMLSLGKNIVLADRALRSGRPVDRGVLTGTELREKTLGVIGLGAIGSRLIELCSPFQMEVLAHDPYVDAATARERHAVAVSLAELLARSDFVQVTCPLTPETEGLLGARQFELMKPTAYLITTARGGIHDEAALIEALEAGRIAGAGLDVFADEPPQPDNPLFSLDSVVATPHVAGITHEAKRGIAVATAEQWQTIFAGGIPPRLLNPAAWPRYSERFSRAFGSRPADHPATAPAARVAIQEVQ